MSADTAGNYRVELRRTTLVWLLLSSATAISWWLGLERVMSSRRMTSLLILTIAIIKVRLVIRYFMNVRSAPPVLRIACDLWVFGLGAALVGLYWMGTT